MREIRTSGAMRGRDESFGSFLPTLLSFVVISFWTAG